MAPLSSLLFFLFEPRTEVAPDTKKGFKMCQVIFEAGKVYRVRFENGDYLDVQLIGGEPPRFHVDGSNSSIGIERLLGYASIEEIRDNLE